MPEHRTASRTNVSGARQAALTAAARELAIAEDELFMAGFSRPIDPRLVSDCVRYAALLPIVEAFMPGLRAAAKQALDSMLGRAPGDEWKDGQPPVGGDDPQEDRP